MPNKIHKIIKQKMTQLILVIEMIYNSSKLTSNDAFFK